MSGTGRRKGDCQNLPRATQRERAVGSVLSARREGLTLRAAADQAGVPCSRRVGKLYLPLGGRYYGCRHCHRLTYTRCQESRKYDGLFRLLARDTGMDFRTVKWAMNQIGKRG